MNETEAGKRLHLIPSVAWYAPGPGPGRHHLLAFMSQHIKDRRARVTRFQFMEDSTSWQDGVHFFVEKHKILSRQVNQFLAGKEAARNIRLEDVRELLEQTRLEEIEAILKRIFHEPKRRQKR